MHLLNHYSYFYEKNNAGVSGYYKKKNLLVHLLNHYSYFYEKNNAGVSGYYKKKIFSCISSTTTLISTKKIILGWVVIIKNK